VLSPVHEENALVKNRGGKACIKIVNTRDINERIVAPEVELEELNKIVISRSKNSSLCNKDVQTRAIAINHIQSTRNHPLRKLLHLDHLNKEEAIHMNGIINKYSDLFSYRMCRHVM